MNNKNAQISSVYFKIISDINFKLSNELREITRNPSPDNILQCWLISRNTVFVFIHGNCPDGLNCCQLLIWVGFEFGHVPNVFVNSLLSFFKLMGSVTDLIQAFDMAISGVINMAVKKKSNYSIKWIYFVSRVLYYTGLGECWYEAPSKSSLQKKVYSVLSFTSMLLIGIFLILQVASMFKNNLSKDEKYDTVLNGVTNPFVFVKCMTMILKKERIRKLLRIILVETKQLYVEETFERAQVKKSIKYSAVLFITTTLSLTFSTIEGARKHFKHGVPMRTVITYYPDSDNFSWQGDLARWVAQFFWWYLAACMLASDFLALSSVIYLAFHFKTLQDYFKTLKIAFERNELGKSQIELEYEMKRGFSAGLKQHYDILWCARDIQKNLGNIYSCQVMQSVASIVLCLAKLDNSERNVTNVVATGAFIACTLALTGTYMWSAGDVTLEAARVSDAMFHSGWHLCSARAGMRQLLLTGIQQSQTSVVMSAFGVLDLSYGNFILIIKQSYSLFAVLY